MDWLSFVIGIIVGWAIEFLIDYFYWRSRRVNSNADRELAAALADLSSCRTKVAGLEDEVRALENKLRAKDAKLDDLSEAVEVEAKRANALEADITKLQAVIDAKGAELHVTAAKLSSTSGELAICLAAASAAKANREPDDLTRIWGIGPKIKGLLHDNDIKTFDDLANTGAERISEILHDAGDRFRLSQHNLHETWPEQARIAATGKWNKLTEWHNRFKDSR